MYARSSIDPLVVRLCLLLLCAAYLQGSIEKALEFPAAVAEMRHFGLAPAAPFAVATIVFELVASALVISGRWRWLGALALAGFTVAASLLANRFWDVRGDARQMAENGFFQHLGLAGAFLYVAWTDWRASAATK